MGKLLGEVHVGELQLVRALLEEARCVETARGGRLRASRRGHTLLAGAKAAVFAELFRIAFWRLSLNLFGKAECGSWPQQQVGMALWALSTTGDRFQGTRALMVLSVLPDEAVSRHPEWGRRRCSGGACCARCGGSAWSNAASGARTSTTRDGARARCSTGSSASGRTS